MWRSRKHNIKNILQSISSLILNLILEDRRCVWFPDILPVRDPGPRQGPLQPGKQTKIIHEKKIAKKTWGIYCKQGYIYYIYTIYIYILVIKSYLLFQRRADLISLLACCPICVWFGDKWIMDIGLMKELYMLYRKLKAHKNIVFWIDDPF